MSPFQSLSLRICLASVTVVMSLAASAAEQVFPCPAEVQPASMKVDAPKGYKSHGPSPFRLTGAGLMWGPPETMATSVPHKTTEKGGKETDSWAGIEHEPVKWMACTYEDGLVVLSQPIDPRAKACSVTRSKAKGRYVIDARCSW
ncbi:MAG: STY0301 family protein [Gammaproteobacteria bacterium]